MNQNDDISATFSKELDHLFQINQVISLASHWKPALDQIVPLLRPIFIFDNLVLWLPDRATSQLEVAYARVVGRGRSIGPDINWGETVANQVYSSGQQSILQPEPDPANIERLNQPYLLGIPLIINETPAGSLVFIRFGGPIYNEDNIRLAKYVSGGISLILRYLEVRQKLLILEAERQQAQLQEDFISTISHELLTPLGFIKGYTTTLLRTDTTWDASNRKEFLTIVDEETDRLQELIDNMLDSARLQSGNLMMEFQPVRLDALLKDVSMRAHQHHPDLQIQFNTNEPIPPIQGDPRRLAQVFENLISNAIKYATGSPITVTVSDKKENVHLTFQDEGPGISSQYIPHLFERFFRNPDQAPNVRGTGLGLYICRQIIQAHHGTIYIESTLGEGTTVHIDIPYHQTKSGRPVINKNKGPSKE